MLIVIKQLNTYQRTGLTCFNSFLNEHQYIDILTLCLRYLHCFLIVITCVLVVLSSTARSQRVNPFFINSIVLQQACMDVNWEKKFIFVKKSDKVTSIDLLVLSSHLFHIFIKSTLIYWNVPVSLYFFLGNQP